MDVGTVVLHRMEQVAGFTISATSAAAPPKARKDYEKGTEQFRKGKFDEAQKKLEEAVSLYPNYAVAWVELGRAHVQKHNASGAKEAFQRAISADSCCCTISRMAKRWCRWRHRPRMAMP